MFANFYGSELDVANYGGMTMNKKLQAKDLINVGIIPILIVV